MKLYLENDESAGLYDVAQWWLETYPEDIFIGKTKNVKLLCEVRERLKQILAMRK